MTLNVTERGTKTNLRAGKDKSSSTPVKLTEAQNERVNKALVKAIIDELSQEKPNWIAFSRD